MYNGCKYTYKCMNGWIQTSWMDGQMCIDVYKYLYKNINGLVDRWTKYEI